HAAQLMGYEAIVNAIDFVTKNSAKALAIEDGDGIGVGKPANFIVIDAMDEYEAIRTQACVLYSIRNGKMIAQTKRAESTIFMGNYAEEVEFCSWCVFYFAVPEA